MINRLLTLLICFVSISVYAAPAVEIKITGVDQTLEKNVRLYLSIEQQKESLLINDANLRRLHQKAPKEIARALQPFGYYRALVTSRISQEDSNLWQVEYIIDPGPALRIGNINLSFSEEVSLDTEFQNLMNSSPFNQGQIFNHLDYDQFKSDLIKLASERGYFDAPIQQSPGRD